MLEEEVRNGESPPPEASKKDGDEDGSLFQQHSQPGAIPGLEQGWLYVGDSHGQR